MTFAEGLAEGLHVAAFVLGFLAPIAILALVVLAIVAIDIPHRVRVIRIRREARRSGRRTL